MYLFMTPRSYVLLPALIILAEEKWGQKGCLPQSVPPLSWRRPVVAILGKGVRCQWGQFGMCALPYAPPNIDHKALNRRVSSRPVRLLNARKPKSSFNMRERVLNAIFISLAIVFCRRTVFRLIRARIDSTTFFVCAVQGCPLFGRSTMSPVL